MTQFKQKITRPLGAALFGFLYALVPLVVHAGFVGYDDACPPVLWPWFLLAGLLPWLFFLWLLRKVRVTYESGFDEKPFYQNVKRGARLNPPDAFKREGLEIEGWYLNKKCDKRKKWDFKKTRVRRRLTLYPKWIRSAPIVPPAPIASAQELHDDFYAGYDT